MITARTWSRSSVGADLTSTPAVAQPWLRLPIRLTSPLRTYQISPLSPRSLVTRRPTSMTSPEATPASTVSPTPYWSSRIMKTPERKSVTRLRAPKPIATPATPARGQQRRQVDLEGAEDHQRRRCRGSRRTRPSAARSRSPRERCRRRSALTSRPPRAVPSTAWARAVHPLDQLGDGAADHIRSTSAITRISRMRRPVVSQVDQFSSTQPGGVRRRLLWRPRATRADRRRGSGRTGRRRGGQQDGGPGHGRTSRAGLPPGPAQVRAPKAPTADPPH